MRLAQQVVPQRLRTLAPEAVKFGVIGGLNVIVNAVVFNLLLIAPIFADAQLKAKVIATCVAVVSSYFMNRHWTYKDRDKTAAHREFVLFVVFNMAGMAIELAVMGITKYWFGLTSILALNVALVIGLALGTVFRFFTYRTFVFTPVAEPTPAVPLVAAQFEQLTRPLEAEFANKRRRATKRRSPAPARSR
jgi:putative flippase GtrA